MPAIITLTTDFGLSDPYVGIMKGVLLGIAPGAVLVDLAHALPPHDLMAGALALEAASPFFPAGTIHLAVVDPGVGSERAAVAVATGTAVFVGPDNGLFTLALARAPMQRAVRLVNTSYHRHPVSATFHGRDIFAPAAAHLAAGVPLEALGEPIETLVALDLPSPQPRGDILEIHGLTADRFGNLVTDLTVEAYALWNPAGAPVRLRTGTVEIEGIRRTYADAARGEMLAYFGSGGRLEIGAREGSAAARLGAAGCVVQMKQVPATAESGGPSAGRSTR